MDKEIIEYAKNKWFTCNKVDTGKYYCINMIWWFVLELQQLWEEKDNINDLKKFVDLMDEQIKYKYRKIQEDTPTV